MKRNTVIGKVKKIIFYFNTFKSIIKVIGKVKTIFSTFITFKSIIILNYCVFRDLPRNYCKFLKSKCLMCVHAYL